ncbi:hypothetical protein MTP99_015036 [Tenebrio molitor]|nr:hypothetical protein MTP99_015036 [Tenebrio molitor]
MSSLREMEVLRVNGMSTLRSRYFIKIRSARHFLKAVFPFARPEITKQGASLTSNTSGPVSPVRETEGPPFFAKNNGSHRTVLRVLNQWNPIARR